MKKFLLLLTLMGCECEPPCPKGEVLIRYNCDWVFIWVGKTQHTYQDCDEKCVREEVLK